MNASTSVSANLVGYTLSVLTVPASGVDVAVSPMQAIYPPGASVTLTASSTQGYVFTSWGGSASGNQNPLTEIMNGNKSTR